MASQRTIVSVTSLNDGVSGSVVISGPGPAPPPNNFALSCSRTPDGAVLTPLPYVGNGPLVATFPHMGFWYVWLTDSVGTSTQGAPGYISAAPDTNANLIGLYLRDRIFAANIGGLQALLQESNYPGTTLTEKAIVYGTPANIDIGPSIVIAKPHWSTSYVGMPYLRQVRYSMTISFQFVHTNEESELRFATAMAEGASDILNQRAYETIILPNGRTMKYCQATDGESVDAQITDLMFASIGTLTWTCLTELWDTEL